MLEKIAAAEKQKVNKDDKTPKRKTRGLDQSNESVKTKNPVSKRRRTGKWCELHQTDTHDTGECKVLLEQAKRMRGVWETNKGNPNFRKTKPDFRKGFREEVNALVVNAVSQAFKDRTKPSPTTSIAQEEHFTLSEQTLADLQLSDSEDDEVSRRMTDPNE